MKVGILFLLLLTNSKSIHSNPQSLKVALPKIDIKQQQSFMKIFHSWDAASVMNQLRPFVNAGLPYRLFGLPGHQKAREHLRNELSKYSKSSSVMVIEQTFDYKKETIKQFFQSDFDKNFAKHYTKTDPEHQKWNKFLGNMLALVDKLHPTKGINFIWKKETNNDRPWIIVTAGYDTIGVDWDNQRPLAEGTFPGADANGSSVALALGLIAGFEKLDFKNNLMVIFTDMHPLAFQGTQHFIKSLGTAGLPPAKSIALTMSLEMLGHDSKIFDKSKKLGNFKVYTSINSFPSYAQEAYSVSLFDKSNSSLKGDINFEWMDNQFENADAFRFWDASIPAVVFSQNWEEDFNQKRYLTSQDMPETLNAKTMANALKYIGRGLWYLVNDDSLGDTQVKNK